MTFGIFILFGLLLIGIPIGIAFPLLVIANAETWNIDWAVLPSTTFGAVSSFPLLAIPLFILAGEVMNRGGLIKQLIDVCDRLLGWLRAPMGHVMIAASAMMGAITGSSVATVAAIGGAVGPVMMRRGYPPGYTAALNAASGMLGVLIPPSIPLILYGSIVGVSITQLFLAAILPGILMVIAFMTVHFFMTRRVLASGHEHAHSGNGAKSDDAAKSLPSILFRSAPALMLPVVVLGGIYSGVFTPTEAAAVATMYALFVMLLGRTGRFGDLSDIFSRAALSSAAILVVIAFTSVFNRALVLEQIPQSIAAFAPMVTDSVIVFLLVINVALLLIGMLMETNAATLLMGPLLAPAAASYGIDPVHLGIILVVNIELGLLTPPMAANLFVAARTNDVALIALLRYIGWFIFAALIVVACITFIPALPLWYRYF
ncbi:TRAP transporter, DctM subunit [Modicisalibacter muralis]|uniref:TRAP transporter large permease protein n=1 Tax=Modicisalibacter muralis TaxID=119000 RepID=A0A1G9M7C9_9GAMM|nr:TRAP transporter large permease [Halomonas muralis]SDL69867.1 TRAP transporter, DctM subunit [Halomonas muralis]